MEQFNVICIFLLHVFCSSNITGIFLKNVFLAQAQILLSKIQNSLKLALPYLTKKLFKIQNKEGENVVPKIIIITSLE